MRSRSWSEPPSVGKIDYFNGFDFRNKPLYCLLHSCLESHGRHWARTAIAHKFQTQRFIFRNLKHLNISAICFQIRANAIKGSLNAADNIFSSYCNWVHPVVSSTFFVVVKVAFLMATCRARFSARSRKAVAVIPSFKTAGKPLSPLSRMLCTNGI